MRFKTGGELLCTCCNCTTKGEHASEIFSGDHRFFSPTNAVTALDYVFLPKNSLRKYSVAQTEVWPNAAKLIVILGTDILHIHSLQCGIKILLHDHWQHFWGVSQKTGKWTEQIMGTWLYLFLQQLFLVNGGMKISGHRPTYACRR